MPEACSPSVVPSDDGTVYVVLDDFGQLGRAYRETDERAADLDSVVADFVTGQFVKPVRVVAFNTAKGWSCDVSENVAWEVLKRSVAEGAKLSSGTREFAIFHLGEKETLLAEHALL